MAGWIGGEMEGRMDGSKLRVFGLRPGVDGLSAAVFGGGCVIFGGNVVRCTQNRGNAITKTPKSKTPSRDQFEHYVIRNDYM